MKYLVQPTYSMLDSHFALFSLPWGVFSSLRPCVWLRRQHVQQQVPASSCKLSGIFLCLYASVWKYPRKYLSIFKYALGNDPISHWRKYALRALILSGPKFSLHVCTNPWMIYFRLRASPLFPSLWSARESVEKVRTQLQIDPDPVVVFWHHYDA